jgi:membrane-associated protein
MADAPKPFGCQADRRAVRGDRHWDFVIGHWSLSGARVDLIWELFQRLNTLDELIRWGGYTVLTVIVFTETGLMIGFFLPGDSLLVTAGLLAAAGTLDLGWLNALLIPAAVAGDSVGYWIGAKAGHALFARPDSRVFSRKHLLYTQAFYERHGGKTIVLARFVPIVRTFAPVVAGVAEMRYRRFIAYNVFGGIGWVASMTSLGFFLGRVIPNIDRHVHIVIAIVICLSILPGIIEVWRARRRAH